MFFFVAHDQDLLIQRQSDKVSFVTIQYQTYHFNEQLLGMSLLTTPNLVPNLTPFPYLQGQNVYNCIFQF